MIGYLPDQLICHRKADLYLVLGTDAPFIETARASIRAGRNAPLSTASPATHCASPGPTSSRFQATGTGVSNLTLSDRRAHRRQGTEHFLSNC